MLTVIGLVRRVAMPRMPRELLAAVRPRMNGSLNHADINDQTERTVAQNASVVNSTFVLVLRDTHALIILPCG